MHPQTVFAKTAKGVLEIKSKTIKLPQDVGLVFLSVDGKSTVADLAQKSGLSGPQLDEVLDKLVADGYIKIFAAPGAPAAADLAGDGRGGEARAPVRGAAGGGGGEGARARGAPGEGDGRRKIRKPAARPRPRPKRTRSWRNRRSPRRRRSRRKPRAPRRMPKRRPRRSARRARRPRTGPRPRRWRA